MALILNIETSSTICSVVLARNGQTIAQRESKVDKTHATLLTVFIDEILREQVRQKPVLAICVGMQALMQTSEENGGVDCISLFAGHVRRFPDGLQDSEGNKLKVPHMGWNRVRQTMDHPMWRGIEDQARFYFVHSYFVQPESMHEVAAVSDYPDSYCVAVTHKNVFAVQFHPEKTQHNGLQVYENFLTWNGQP